MFDKNFVLIEIIPLGEFKADYLGEENSYMVVPLDIKPVMISQCLQN